MRARIEACYARKQNRSLKTVQYCFKHLGGGFSVSRVIDITTPAVQEYTTKRLQSGVPGASINRELAYLRHGFKLMLKAGEISAIPAVIELIQGENIRKGFLAPAEFVSLSEKIPDRRAGLVAFLYNAGWRSGEGDTLEWSEVNLSTNMIRLPAEKSKSKKPRHLPIIGELLELIERRLVIRRWIVPMCFIAGASRLPRSRKAFKTAAAEAGMPALLPHDMRRSGVRNFRRAGLSQTEGMKLSGHETDSIYRRYDVISHRVDESGSRALQEKIREPEGCAAKARNGLT
jgi:integrase